MSRPRAVRCGGSAPPGDFSTDRLEMAGWGRRGGGCADRDTPGICAQRTREGRPIGLPSLQIGDFRILILVSDGGLRLRRHHLVRINALRFAAGMYNGSSQTLGEPKFPRTVNDLIGSLAIDESLGDNDARTEIPDFGLGKSGHEGGIPFFCMRNQFVRCASDPNPGSTRPPRIRGGPTCGSSPTSRQEREAGIKCPPIVTIQRCISNRLIMHFVANDWQLL